MSKIILHTIKDAKHQNPLFKTKVITNKEAAAEELGTNSRYNFI